MPELTEQQIKQMVDHEAAPQRSQVSLLDCEFETPSTPSGVTPGKRAFPAEFIAQQTGKQPQPAAQPQPAPAAKPATPQDLREPEGPPKQPETVEETVDLENMTPEQVAEVEQRVFETKLKQTSLDFVQRELNYAPSPRNAKLMFDYLREANLAPTPEAFDEAYAAVKHQMSTRAEVNAERAAYGLPPLPPAGTVPEPVQPTEHAAPEQPRDEHGRFVSVQTGLSDRPGPAAAVSGSDLDGQLKSILAEGDTDTARLAMMRLMRAVAERQGPRQY
jgi:hypothetical protein